MPLIHPSLVPSVVLAATLAAIAFIDARSRRIPDRLSLPLLACGLAWAWWEGATPWSSHLLGAAAGYASLAAFGEGYFRLRGREGLGLGDAKLFAAGGAWLGWATLPLVLLIGTIGALVYALVTGKAEARSEIAFGPWLALGIWVGWLLHI